MDQPPLSYFAQGKDIIALLALVWLLGHTYLRIIPDLLLKKDQDLTQALTSLSQAMDRLGKLLEEVRHSLISREKYYDEIKETLQESKKSGKHLVSRE